MSWLFRGRERRDLDDELSKAVVAQTVATERVKVAAVQTAMQADTARDALSRSEEEHTSLETIRAISARSAARVREARKEQ